MRHKIIIDRHTVHGDLIGFLQYLRDMFAVRFPELDFDVEPGPDFCDFGALYRATGVNVEHIVEQAYYDNWAAPYWLESGFNIPTWRYPEDKEHLGVYDFRRCVWLRH